jgi:DNA-binding NarL/FixJ family response regulator
MRTAMSTEPIAARPATSTPTPTSAAGPPTLPLPLPVVLVDDHAIVRQGLRSILEREPDLAVVAEASTAGEAMAVIERTRPAIVLLDLKLSIGSETEGLQLCSRLTERYPGLAVLVLSTFIDDHLVREAIEHGARGYVVKDVDTTELLRAIRAVARNESAFDSRAAAAMVRALRRPTDRPSFTEREQRVLELLARGLSNRDIGERLYISETTVKFHVRNIMRKLGAATRAEAVYEASKMGVI